MSFIVEALTVLLGILLGFFVLKGPNWLLLDDSKALWPEVFIKTYPHKKWVPRLHQFQITVGSILMIILIMSQFNYIAPKDSPSSLYFALFITYYSTGLGLINALFELIFAVSPVLVGQRVQQGWGSRGIWVSKYLANQDLRTIRVVGVVRLLLGTVIVGGITFLLPFYQ